MATSSVAKQSGETQRKRGSRTAKAPRAGKVVDLASLLAEARLVLERDGFVKIAKLGPPTVRQTVASELERAGFELTRTVVRRPIEEQLRAAFSAGAFIAKSAIGSHVLGASATELKPVIEKLLSTGEMRLVLRGTAETFVPGSTKVMSKDQLAQLKRELSVLLKAIDKVSKGRTQLVKGLLESDVLESLRDALSVIDRAQPSAALCSEPISPSNAREESAFDSIAIALLLDTIDAAKDMRTGLSFVPDVVEKLGKDKRGQVLAALVSAATSGVLELRPEGGLGRLSEEELALCPEGPHGTRLSWARRIDGDSR